MTVPGRRSPDLRVWKDILELHLDEASFLWGQRRMGLLAPDWSLRELVRHEERLLAHVDGLVLGGEPVVEVLLRPVLAAGEWDQLAAAAFALLEGSDTGMDAVLARLWTGEPPQRLVLRSVLELSGREALGGRLRELLAMEDVGLVAIALEVLGARGELPEDVVGPMLSRSEPELHAAILRAVMMGRPSALRWERVAPLLSSSQVGVRMAAIEAGLVLGRHEAWAACASEVQGRGEDCEDAMLLLALGGGAREVELVVNQLSQPELRAAALWALGFSGAIPAAEACLEWMGDKEVGQVAGESFSAITGLRLRDDLALSPEGSGVEEPVALEEEDLDADLSLRPEEGLPRPAAGAVSGWWGKERERFDRARRYLHGRPRDAAVLLDALAHDSLRRRHVLAREVRLRSRGKVVVRTGALAPIQREDMARAASHASSLSMEPLNSGGR